MRDVAVCLKCRCGVLWHGQSLTVLTHRAAKYNSYRSDSYLFWFGKLSFMVLVQVFSINCTNIHVKAEWVVIIHNSNSLLVMAHPFFPNTKFCSQNIRMNLSYREDSLFEKEHVHLLKHSWYPVNLLYEVGIMHEFWKLKTVEINWKFVATYQAIHLNS